MNEKLAEDGLPKYRRDYSAEELDERPLIMLRTFPMNVLIWRGQRRQRLDDYLEERILKARADTQR